MNNRARWRQVALVAAIIGAGISAYLLVEYASQSGGICITGTGCDEVRLSAYAYPLGVPMPLYGLAFYLVAAWVAWRTVDPSPILGVGPRLALLALGIAGVAVSAVLTGLEAFVIGAFCTWCLAQAAASVVLCGAAVALWRAGPPAPSQPEGSRRRQRQVAREVDAERSSLRRSGIMAAGGMAILVGLLLVGGALGRSSTPGPSASGGNGLAPASAPHEGSGAVTVVEFSDFQCPACAAVSPYLQQLVDEGLVTLYYRNFPLPQHANAVLMARAAAAAQLQGKFWPLHDAMFRSQQAWESLSSGDARAYVTQLATDAGLDVERWKADLDSSAVRDIVQADADQADQLSLPGTPSIYINGIRYNGSLTLDALRSAVAAAG